MARLLHLSDLHFGRDRPELVKPLAATAAMLRPDAVIVSGDLTQRARVRQFRQVSILLNALVVPVLSVPGNHDVPLWNVLFRLARPYSRYQKIISEDLEPTLQFPGATILGVNSVDPLASQRGKLSSRRVRRTVERLQAAPDGLKLIAIHHPLLHPPGADKDPVEGAEAAARAFAEAGADALLSGHLHLWGVRPASPGDGLPAMLHIQAGTGLSTRLRGEENDFNLIETGPGAIVVSRYVARSDGMAFEAQPSRIFRRSEAGWAEAEPQSPKIISRAETSRSQSSSVV